MSKALVDQLVTDFLKGHKSRWDTVLRRVMNGNPQITTITQEDLYTLYRDNTIASLYAEKSFEEAQKSAKTVKGIETAAGEAAKHVFTNFEKFYLKKRGAHKDRVTRTATKLVIRQPNGLFNAIKSIVIVEGWKSIKSNKALSSGSRKKMAESKGRKKFRQSTQILHEGKKTVGTFILANLYHKVMQATVITGFTEAQTTKIATTIEEFFGELDSEWIKTSEMGEMSLNDELVIPLTIGPFSENPAGAESYDWGKIKPRLAKALMEAAKADKLDVSYATKKGSKPLTQKIQERALHLVVEEVMDAVSGHNSTKVKVSPLPKEDPKKIRHKGNASLKGKPIKGKTKGIKRKTYKKGGKGNKVPPPRMALQNILGILNAKLPQQVSDNMGYPRLENQTGAFAQSVRALDVTETAKGFQSIGYTYKKDPYQVFERTSGTRFSDTDRDPRTLIDTSIREIAAQFGLGRLYTRRM